MLTIREDDLSGEDVQALLALHLEEMREGSPPGHSFALDLAGLRAPAVTVWTGWIDGSLAAIGALKALGDGSAEVKSMRTHGAHLRKGVGAALLDHIIAEARARGYRRLSIETGTSALFEPAFALYRSRGFAEGEAFGEYAPSAFNRFFHLELART